MPGARIEMLWLLPAGLALAFGTYQRSLGEKRWSASNAILFYIALILFIVSQAGRNAFVGRETAFLGYFVAGLALLAAAEGLATWGGKRRQGLAQAGAPLAALSFALGFDVLRPDDYSYAPAAILAVFVAIVAWRTYRMLAAASKRKKGRWPLAAGVSAVGLMVFAATFKVMDRGWLLPWSYLAAIGALLFAAAQLRQAAADLKKSKAPAVWLLWLFTQLGVAMMVLAAWFVYKDFL
jgi:hypothetical protein